MEGEKSVSQWAGLAEKKVGSGFFFCFVFLAWGDGQVCQPVLGCCLLKMKATS